RRGEAGLDDVDHQAGVLAGFAATGERLLAGRDAIVEVIKLAFEGFLVGCGHAALDVGDEPGIGRSRGGFRLVYLDDSRHVLHEWAGEADAHDAVRPPDGELLVEALEADRPGREGAGEAVAVVEQRRDEAPVRLDLRSDHPARAAER